MSENVANYRVGSPFAEQSPRADEPLTQPAVAGDSPSPPLAVQPQQIELLSDGAWSQTSLAAVYAAVMLLGFVSLGYWVFPGGGAAVALLGAITSLSGLTSQRFKLAMTTLILHGTLFVICYLHAL